MYENVFISLFWFAQLFLRFCGWIWPVNRITWIPAQLYRMPRGASRWQQRVSGKPANPKQLTLTSKCEWLYIDRTVYHTRRLFYSARFHSFLYSFYRENCKVNLWRTEDFHNNRKRHHNMASTINLNYCLQKMLYYT